MVYVSESERLVEPHQINGMNWSVKSWVLLFIVSGALFLDSIDLSMVNIALPSIGSELNLTASWLQWIVNSYILGYGGFLLLGGRVSDLLGRKLVFLTAVAVFGIASLASAFSSDITTMVVLRFIKGVAAGFTVPAGMSIIATSFAPGPARAKALTIYAILGTLGFGLGLVFGGIFTEFGWRITLFAPWPVATVIFFLGLRFIPNPQKNNRSLKGFDVFGAATMTGALLLLVFAVVEAPEQGWFAKKTLLLFGISTLLLASFIIIEIRHRTPLVRLGILSDKLILHANISAAILIGSFMSYQFVMTLYLAESLKWSPLQIALAFLPSSAPVPIFGKLLAKLFSTYGTTWPILIGMSILSVGYLLLLRTEPGMAYWEFMLPTVICVGVGFALCFGAINIQGVHGINEAEQGLASGLVNTSLQVGGALSLAIAVAIIGGSETSFAENQLLPNMERLIMAIAGLSAAGAIISVFAVLYRWKSF
ncbi:MFS transporter [Pectobacterium carotovorum]|uniref:MFS transporter n=1 Tax=Pectobacterium carotovorum TaxID=554 RepID=UPI0032ED345D